MAQNDNFKPGTIVRFKNFKQKSEMNNSYAQCQKIEKNRQVELHQLYHQNRWKFI